MLSELLSESPNGHPRSLTQGNFPIAALLLLLVTSPPPPCIIIHAHIVTFPNLYDTIVVCHRYARDGVRPRIDSTRRDQPAQASPAGEPLVSFPPSSHTHSPHRFQRLINQGGHGGSSCLANDFISLFPSFVFMCITCVGMWPLFCGCRVSSSGATETRRAR